MGDPLRYSAGVLRAKANRLDDTARELQDLARRLRCDATILDQRADELEEVSVDGRT